MTKLDDFGFPETPETKTAQELKTSQKPKTISKDDRVYYTADFDMLCDVVLDNDQTKFLTYNRKLLTEITIDGKKFLPPPKDKLAYDLPDYARISKYLTGVTGVSGAKGVSGVTMEDKILFDEIAEYHRESAELPDDKLNILITAWDIHTHLLENFGHSPIIFFAGLPEKGKSRMATSMLAVARRGVRKASVSDAQIIREASDQKATIFFDMMDFWGSIQKSGSEDVVLSRFERGLKVARVLNPEKGAFQDMTYFNVYGATIIASNDTIDQVLGSRTITIVMRQAKKKFKNLVDEAKGKMLRDRLVALRLRHHKSELPEVEKIVDGRFGDIMRPLHQIVKLIKPELEADFVEIVKDLQKKRQMGKSNTIEGELVQTILNLYVNVVGGILPVKMITDELNKEKSDKERLTYQRVGRKLDIMGYQKAKTGNGSSAIVWNEEINNSLAIEHEIISHIETPQTPPMAVTSETPETKNNNNNNIISNNNNNNSSEDSFLEELLGK